ncbi:MAG: cupin domain-containing protein [Acidobacteria bacterium]|nr:cupin domain-containing protein [Acidobacteriota bacterium]
MSTAAAKAERNDDTDPDTLFPLGDPAPREYFTGTVHVNMLVPKAESNDYSVASVTFEPGARTNWHRHPAGQTLIIIAGEGLYQEKGQPIRTIAKGESVLCRPDIQHWHGASPTNRMTHLAITNDRGGGNVVWLEPVTDAEYSGRGDDFWDPAIWSAE